MEYKIDVDNAPDLSEKDAETYRIIDELPNRATYLHTWDDNNHVHDVGPIVKIAEWNGFRIGDEVSVGYSLTQTLRIKYFFTWDNTPDKPLCVCWETEDDTWMWDMLYSIRPLGKGENRDSPNYGKEWDWSWNT